MNIRVRTLWRVPVFGLLSSLLGYWLTIFPGYLFYVKRTELGDGSVEVSTDPLRTLLFEGVLFLLVLLMVL